MSMTHAEFEAAVANIKTAIYGKDVRGAISDSMLFVDEKAQTVIDMLDRLTAANNDIENIKTNITTNNADITNLKNEVDGIYDTIKTGQDIFIPTVFINGTIDTTNGISINNTSGVYTPSFIKLKSSKIHVTVRGGYKIIFYIYDQNQDYVKATYYVEASGYVRELQNLEDYYVRASVKRTDNQGFSPDNHPFFSITAEDIFGSNESEETSSSSEVAYRYETAHFTVESGYYRVDSKQVITKYGYYHTKISVNPGEVYIASGTTISPTNLIPCAVAVNSAGEALKTYGGTTESGYANFYNFFVTIPEGATDLYVNGQSAGNINLLRCTLDNYNNVYSPRKLMGKKVVFLGDSIFGHVDTDSSIPKIFARLTGATVFNHAIGGTRGKSRGEGKDFTSSRSDCWGALEGERLATAIATGNFSDQLAAVSSNSALTGHAAYTASRITAMSTFDYTDVDYFIINFATNDFTGGSAVSGWRQGMMEIIKQLCTAYPQATLYLCSATQRFIEENGITYDGNNYTINNETLRDFVEAAEELSYIKNVSFVNLYNIGINLHNWEYYVPGGTHQNELGRQRIAEVLSNSIA